MTRLAACWIISAVATLPLTAQSHFAPESLHAIDSPSATSSSLTKSALESAETAEAIAPVPAPAPRRVILAPQPSVTMSVTSFGPGADFSLPIGLKTSLRAGFHAMSFSGQFSTDSVPYTASIESRTANLQLDYAPFGGNFRISPGVLALNSINVKAVSLVAGGSKISLGDGDYTSSKADPLKATATMKFGYNVSPMMTVGFRSILPSRWKLTMPVDFGAVYNGGPKFAFDMQGSACDSGGNCGKISTDPGAMKDIDRERQSWADSISKFTFMPVVSIGIGYRFGGGGRVQ